MVASAPRSGYLPKSRGLRAPDATSATRDFDPRSGLPVGEELSFIHGIPFLLVRDRTQHGARSWAAKTNFGQRTAANHHAGNL